MTASTIDTLSIAKRIKALGADDAFAEGLAEILKETRDADLSSLATRRDIDSLRQEMLLLEQRLIIKLGGMLVVAVGTVTALVKLL